MTFQNITEQLLLFFTSGFVAGVIFGRVMAMIKSFGSPH